MRVLEATHRERAAARPSWSSATCASARARAARRRCLLAAKIRALFDGRFHVSADDVRSVVKPALRHRIILNFEGEAEGVTSDQILDRDPRVRAGERMSRAAHASCSSSAPASAPREARCADAQELFDEALPEAARVPGARLAPRVRRAHARRAPLAQAPGPASSSPTTASYYAGDDYRQVDWNVYGRSERLMLRLQEQEEDLSVYLLLDCSGSMAFGAPRKLATPSSSPPRSRTSRCNHLDRVSITALRDAVTAAARAHARAQPHLHRVRLPAPAARRRGRPRLADAIGTFAAQNKRRGVAILISDLYDPAGFEEGINRLRYARFETHVIHVTDAARRCAAPARRRRAGRRRDRRAPAGHGHAAAARALRAGARGVRRAHPQLLPAEARRAVHASTPATPADEAVLRILRRGGLLG